MILVYNQGQFCHFRLFQLPWARGFGRALDEPGKYILWTRAEGDGPTRAVARAKGCKVLKSIASVPRVQPSCLEAGATLAFHRTEAPFPLQN